MKTYMVYDSFPTYYVKSFQVTDFFKGECLEMHEDKKYAESNLLEQEVSAAKHSLGESRKRQFPDSH